MQTPHHHLEKSMSDLVQQPQSLLRRRLASEGACHACGQVAQFSAEVDQYETAVEIYEDIAKTSLENNLLKYSAKGYLLNAGICRLCCTFAHTPPLSPGSFLASFPHRTPDGLPPWDRPPTAIHCQAHHVTQSQPLSSAQHGQEVNSEVGSPNLWLC